MIPTEFDEVAWRKDHAAEQKRLLEENGGKEITITPEEVQRARARFQREMRDAATEGGKETP